MENNSKRMSQKPEKLSHHHDTPLRENNDAAKTLQGKELRVFVNELLSYGPKQQTKYKFNEIRFLADVNKLVFCMPEIGV